MNQEEKSAYKQG